MLLSPWPPLECAVGTRGQNQGKQLETHRLGSSQSISSYHAWQSYGPERGHRLSGRGFGLWELRFGIFLRGPRCVTNGMQNRTIDSIVPDTQLTLI